MKYRGTWKELLLCPPTKSWTFCISSFVEPIKPLLPQRKPLLERSLRWRGSEMWRVAWWAVAARGSELSGATGELQPTAGTCVFRNMKLKDLHLREANNSTLLQKTLWGQVMMQQNRVITQRSSIRLHSGYKCVENWNEMTKYFNGYFVISSLWHDAAYTM